MTPGGAAGGPLVSRAVQCWNEPGGGRGGRSGRAAVPSTLCLGARTRERERERLLSAEMTLPVISSAGA